MSNVCVREVCVSNVCVKEVCVSKVCVKEVCVSNACIREVCVSNFRQLAGIREMCVSNLRPRETCVSVKFAPVGRASFDCCTFIVRCVRASLSLSRSRSLSLSRARALSLSLYACTYIYMYRERERDLRPLTDPPLCVYTHTPYACEYTRITCVWTVERVCGPTHVQTHRGAHSLTRERMRTPQHGFFDLLILYIYLFLYFTRYLSTGFAFDLVNFDT